MTARKKILSCFGEQDRLTTNDIHNKLPDVPWGTIGTTLALLARSGELHRVSRGVYMLARRDTLVGEKRFYIEKNLTFRNYLRDRQSPYSDPDCAPIEHAEKNKKWKTDYLQELCDILNAGVEALSGDDTFGELPKQDVITDVLPFKQTEEES